MLATTLDLSNELTGSGPRELMLWLDLKAQGKVVSTNFVSFARPKHMALEQPVLRAAVTDLRDGTFKVTVEAEKPALWAWIALSHADARYSDNFVHVVPGRPVDIVVTPEQAMTPEQLEGQLELRSLFDTFKA
jgi:beta-mannosidase